MTTYLPSHHYLQRQAQLAYFPHRRGEEIPSSKLVAEQVREIHRMAAKRKRKRPRGSKVRGRVRPTFAEIGKRFGITGPHVGNILLGRFWPDIYAEFHPLPVEE